MEEKNEIQKALLLPVNSQKQLFIQDRRGYKKPDWGYFGGSIELGETPIQAVIRETEEELSIRVKEQELIPLGVSETDWDGVHIVRHLFLYQTNQPSFDVKEGNGGIWLSFPEARNYFDDKDRFDEVQGRILKALGA